MKLIVTVLVGFSMVTAAPAFAQAWRDCIPNSIGPGGCESIGPGGGQSIGPGGGLSIGPGGGKSIGPGGGLSIDRERSRGLDTRTMRPFGDAFGSNDDGFFD